MGKSLVDRPRGFTAYTQANAFHSVYLVTPDNGGQGPVKIGIADDPLKRFSSIQTSVWIDLRLHHWWWMAGKRLSERVEKAFIETHKDRHIRGEWFQMPPDEARGCAAEIVKQLCNWASTEGQMIRRFLRWEENKTMREFSFASNRIDRAEAKRILDRKPSVVP